jgi:HEAT repeat protein
MIKTMTAFAALLMFASLSFGAGALNWYVDEETSQEINAAPQHTIISFDDADSIQNIEYSGDVTTLEQVALPDSLGQQGHGLKVSFVDTKDGKGGGRSSLVIPLPEPIDPSQSRALVFNYHVTERFSRYFLGRYDVRARIDDSKMNWTMPAVIPNGHQFIWDFQGDSELVENMTSLRLTLGDMMEGYEAEDIIIGPIKLVSLPKLGPQENVGKVIKEDASWAKRYVALKSLADKSDAESMALALAASSDSSMLIRNTAVDVMGDIATRNPQESAKALKQAMSDDAWRVRVAAIKLIIQMKDQYDWAEHYIRQGLLDDGYFIREACMDTLMAQGESKAQIADTLAQLLDDGDSKQTAAAIRMLREIGPRAVGALPELLSVLRDPYETTLIRCEALAAIWWIDEAPLTPEDWVLALPLNAGEVHTHLLNKSMERLVAGKAASVPALLDVLNTNNPVVQARATACLRLIGPDAKDAQATLNKLAQDEKWYLAYQAESALRAIAESTAPVDILPPQQSMDSSMSVVNDGEYITVSNGTIEMLFEVGNDEGGPKIIRRVGGDNLVDGDWLYKTLAFKHSKAANVLERRWIQKLFGSPIPKGKDDVKQEVFYQDDDVIDFMVKYAKPGGDVEYEYHYVLKNGKSGYYFYAVTRNMTGHEMGDKTSFSGKGIGRLGQLTALTWGAYDYGFCADTLRRPAAFAPDVITFYTENYPDIYQCTFRMPDGVVAAKHEWAVSELESDVVGFAGLKEGGFWMITPSQESRPTALPRRMAGGINNNLILNSITGKYYIRSDTVIPADWEKVSGPFFFYINDGENIEEMWIDAQRQAKAEKDLFPYKWLGAFNFQDRGAVRGNVQIADGQNPAGTYIILSNPIDMGDPQELTTWMRNAGPYVYWTQADKDGNYEIEDVRSDAYGVYAYKPGVHGLAEVENKVQVKRGEVAVLDELIITPKSNGKLLWQIGVPDGGPTEFRNGNNYHIWENYIRYAENFPDGVHYTVGESDWSRDWNYIQPACIKEEGKPTTWTIDFQIDELPKAKTLLTIACAGRGAKAFVMLNSEKLGNLNVSYMGVQHVRTHPYGEMVLREYEIDPEKLNRGTNTIELTFSLAKSKGELVESVVSGKRFRNWTSWLSYDFIRLEEMQ